MSKETGKVSQSIPDIKSIGCYYNFSVKGNATQFPCDAPGMGQMIDDYCIFLSDKEFLEKYSDKISSNFDDDDFEENGSVDEFRVTQEYYITFKDGSAISVDFGLPDFNFQSADTRNNDEVDNPMSEKWIGEYEADGWDMDIDTLSGQVPKETMASGGKVKDTYYVEPISGETRKLFKGMGLFVFKRTTNGLVVAEDLKTHLYGLYTPEGDEVAPAKYQYIDEEVNANGMTRVVHSNGDSGAIEAFVNDDQDDEMAKGGEVEDIKSKMYSWFKAWLGNFISDEELVSSLKRKLGKKWFRFFKGDTLASDARTVENSMKTRDNRAFLKENMEYSIEQDGLEIYNFKGDQIFKNGGSVKGTSFSSFFSNNGSLFGGAYFTSGSKMAKGGGVSKEKTDKVELYQIQGSGAKDADTEENPDLIFLTKKKAKEFIPYLRDERDIEGKLVVNSVGKHSFYQIQGETEDAFTDENPDGIFLSKAKSEDFIDYLRVERNIKGKLIVGKKNSLRAPEKSPEEEPKTYILNEEDDGIVENLATIEYSDDPKIFIQNLMKGIREARGIPKDESEDYIQFNEEPEVSKLRDGTDFTTTDEDEDVRTWFLTKGSGHDSNQSVKKSPGGEIYSLNELDEGADEELVENLGLVEFKINGSKGDFEKSIMKAVREARGIPKDEAEDYIQFNEELEVSKLRDGMTFTTTDEDEDVRTWFLSKKTKMKSGGKLSNKKNWIADALSGGKNKGALRRTAMRKGLLRNADEKLSMTDLHKLEKIGGKTSKRAHLAETLKKFATGGVIKKDEKDHLVELLEKNNNNVDAAMQAYAGELGIYNLYHGHKVDSVKKAKWNSAYNFLNTLQHAEAYGEGGIFGDGMENEILNGYLSAVLFTDSDDEGDSLDYNYSSSDFDPKTLTTVKKMVQEYIADNKDAIEFSGLGNFTIGSNMWYVQQGHGVGFSDHNLDKETEEKLTKGAKKFGYQSANSFAQDGKVYIEGIKI